MAEITAAQVKKLRDATGLGMMDCKKALVETDGDFDLAVTYLREKNKGLGEKKADREANQGAIGVYVVEDGATGAIIEVNCETDFVGKNETFRASSPISLIRPRIRPIPISNRFCRRNTSKMNRKPCANLSWKASRRCRKTSSSNASPTSARKTA